MNPRERCIKKLECEEGFRFRLHGKKHDKYFSEELNYTITIKRHDFDEDDERYILKEIKYERKRQGK